MQNFKRFTSEGGIRELLAGAGILAAAKEELTKNGAAPATGPSGCSKSVEIGK
jgi:ABC-type iron transport system FetAB ATPase subunit